MKMCRNCVRYPADGNVPMHVISLSVVDVTLNNASTYLTNRTPNPSPLAR